MARLPVMWSSCTWRCATFRMVIGQRDHPVPSLMRFVRSRRRPKTSPADAIVSQPEDGARRS